MILEMQAVKEDAAQPSICRNVRLVKLVGWGKLEFYPAIAIAQRLSRMVEVPVRQGKDTL